MKALFKEVIGLHQFIQDWLTGSVPKTREEYSRFDDALDTDFRIVHPSGTLERRDQLVESFWSAHAAKEPTFSIEIRNLRFRLSFGPYALLTYEEWQHGPSTTARLSTVVFRVADDGGKVRWAHLHETWMPT